MLQIINCFRFTSLHPYSAPPELMKHCKSKKVRIYYIKYIQDEMSYAVEILVLESSDDESGPDCDCGKVRGGRIISAGFPLILAHLA